MISVANCWLVVAGWWGILAESYDFAENIIAQLLTVGL
jgi:hypothetical protein